MPDDKRLTLFEAAGIEILAGHRSVFATYKDVERWEKEQDAERRRKRFGACSSTRRRASNSQQ